MSSIKLQELNKVTRYETKRVVLSLIARNLAEWVVRGTYAREIEPPKIEHGWKVRGSFKSLQELQGYSTTQEDFTALPPAELVGLTFEEPYRRRREIPLCAVAGLSEHINLLNLVNA